jgi:protein-L-isoaspartate(D-aspartate) O-methyltransferase
MATSPDDEPEAVDYRQQRNEMVKQQIAGRGIRDVAVLAAMAAVPRELFVREPYRDYAYEDTPLPISGGQTISQPYVVAYMLSALKLRPGERVLEIGTGSGYAAALLSRIVQQVYTVERIPELAEYARRRLEKLGYDNVQVLLGDGTLGWPEHAPYDGIIVAAGGPAVPPALREQLAVGGRLVMPVGKRRRHQDLILLYRLGESEFKQEQLSPVAFVPLIGEEGWKKG